MILRNLCAISRIVSKCHVSTTKSFPKNIDKMQNAYFRYQDGEDHFQLSFQFSCEHLRVNRQFNFSRKMSETITDFLGRVCTNLERTLFKKKKKIPEGTSSEMKVHLYNNGEPVSGESICKDILFNNNNKLLLQVQGKDYSVIVNAPWVVMLSLPSSIMAGFPVYPNKVDTLFSDKNACEFKWLKSSISMGPLKNEPVTWVQVGEGYFYTPSTSDIGHKLKLSCVPKNGDQEGPQSEVISSTSVGAGPGMCPFEKRHVFTKERLPSKNFRVVSYNILADLYADSEVARTQLYPYCPPYALTIDYRKQLILRELLGYNADLICLQEVDSKIFDLDLTPVLGSVGYEGVFHRKGGTVSEGVACLFHKSKFSWSVTPHLGKFSVQASDRLNRSIQRFSVLKFESSSNDWLATSGVCSELRRAILGLSTEATMTKALGGKSLVTKLVGCQVLGCLLLDTKSVVLAEELKTNSLFSDIWKRIEKNCALAERFLARTTCLQCTVLESVEDPREQVIVGNTHLYFHPNADHIRLLQGGMTIIYLQDIFAKLLSMNVGSAAVKNLIQDSEVTKIIQDLKDSLVQHFQTIQSLNKALEEKDETLSNFESGRALQSSLIQDLRRELLEKKEEVEELKTRQPISTFAVSHPPRVEVPESFDLLPGFSSSQDKEPNVDSLKQELDKKILIIQNYDQDRELLEKTIQELQKQLTEQSATIASLGIELTHDKEHENPYLEMVAGHEPDIIRELKSRLDYLERTLLEKTEIIDNYEKKIASQAQTVQELSESLADNVHTIKSFEQEISVNCTNIQELEAKNIKQEEISQELKHKVIEYEELVDKLRAELTTSHKNGELTNDLEGVNHLKYNLATQSQIIDELNNTLDDKLSYTKEVEKRNEELKIMIENESQVIEELKKSLMAKSELINDMNNEFINKSDLVKEIQNSKEELKSIIENLRRDLTQETQRYEVLSNEFKAVSSIALKLGEERDTQDQLIENMKQNLRAEAKPVPAPRDTAGGAEHIEDLKEKRVEEVKQTSSNWSGELILKTDAIHSLGEETDIKDQIIAEFKENSSIDSQTIKVLNEEVLKKSSIIYELEEMKEKYEQEIEELKLLSESPHVIEELNEVLRSKLVIIKDLEEHKTNHKEEIRLLQEDLALKTQEALDLKTKQDVNCDVEKLAYTCEQHEQTIKKMSDEIQHKEQVIHDIENKLIDLVEQQRKIDREKLQHNIEKEREKTQEINEKLFAIQNLEKETKQQVQTIDKLKKLLEEHQREHELKLSEKSEVIQKLREELNSSLSLIDKLESDLRDGLLAIKDLETELELQVRVNGELRDELVQQAAIVQGLQDDISQTTQDRLKTEAQNQRISIEGVSDNDIKKLLENRLNKAGTYTINDIEKEFEKKDRKLEELKEERNNHLSRIKELEKELHKSALDVQDMERDVKKHISELDVRNKSIEEQKAKLVGQSQVIDELNDQLAGLEGLQQQIKSKDLSIRELEEEVHVHTDKEKTLEARLKELENELAQAHASQEVIDDNLNQTKTILDMKIALEDKDQTIRKLEQEVFKHSQALEVLQNDLASSHDFDRQTELQEMMTELRNQSTVVSELMRDRELQTDTVQVFRKQVVTLEEQLSEREAQDKARVQEDISKLENTLAERELEITSLKESEEEFTKYVNKLLVEKEELYTRIYDLQKDLEKMNAELLEQQQQILERDRRIQEQLSNKKQQLQDLINKSPPQTLTPGEVITCEIVETAPKQVMKKIIDLFDSNEATSIKVAQELLSDPEISILATNASLLHYFQPHFFAELRELSSFTTLFLLSFICSGKSQECWSFTTLLSFFNELNGHASDEIITVSYENITEQTPVEVSQDNGPEGGHSNLGGEIQTILRLKPKRHTDHLRVYSHLCRGRVENNFGKNPPGPPDQDLNLNLLATSSLVYSKSRALDHATTQGKERQTYSRGDCDLLPTPVPLLLFLDSKSSLMEGWVFIPDKPQHSRLTWKKQYALVASRSITFYETESDKLSNNYLIYINLMKVLHAGPLHTSDYFAGDKNDIPNIFKIVYVEDEENSDSFRTLNDNEHMFRPVTYKKPTDCCVCPHQLGHVFKNIPALECTRCYLKIHEEHLTEQASLPSCSVSGTATELLVMTNNPETLVLWVQQIQHKMKKLSRVHMAKSMDDLRSNRTTKESFLRDSRPNDLLPNKGFHSVEDVRTQTGLPAKASGYIGTPSTEPKQTSPQQSSLKHHSSTNESLSVGRSEHKKKFDTLPEKSFIPSQGLMLDPDFDKFTKYPVTRLKKPFDLLPPEVNIHRKEVHLDRQEFINIFGMEWEAFAMLPNWKQQNIKKKVGLF
uniref:Uncharacterized protein n=1 Tax=Timema tahoe TaxID=61484 RepID=A0A7R9FKG7_9NEOP|nr:unnamed protein product [Timema tahoe]